MIDKIEIGVTYNFQDGVEPKDDRFVPIIKTGKVLDIAPTKGSVFNWPMVHTLLEGESEPYVINYAYLFRNINRVKQPEAQTRLNL
ncbi:unnamed protein product [marine sediment metagenome]|uniref:Uncharacterized protein n=1 Tax=marine sediment metagenome TaxID=412755 RepID=X0SY75_9ZZZZ